MTRQKVLADSPIVAGVASLAHRGDGPVSVVDMMVRAVTAMADDVVAHRSGVRVDEVLAAIDVVIAPRGTWAESDPARAALALVGRRGAPVRSIVSEIGVLQQSALHRAVEEVRSGDARAVLILGAEAKYSADRLGGSRDQRGDGTEPDEVVRPHGDIVHPVEIAQGLVMPVQQYALIEDALARAAGRSTTEQAAMVADLWAHGSAAATGRDDAWSTDPVSAADILGGRVMAGAYHRGVVSSWSVDQAVALLVTTPAIARSWGLADDDVVGLVGSSVTDHVVPLVARADLTGCPAFALGADAIEASTGVHPRDADLVDLYSCFPSAVEVAARDLGLAGRQWTVTGGMAVFGGPFNSYALHGMAAVIAGLRGRPDAIGATTCVSGLLSKVGVAVWRTGIAPASLHDVTESDRVARQAVDVVEPALAGNGVVIASIDCPNADGSTTTFSITETPDGARSLLRNPSVTPRV